MKNSKNMVELRFGFACSRVTTSTSILRALLKRRIFQNVQKRDRPFSFACALRYLYRGWLPRVTHTQIYHGYTSNAVGVRVAALAWAFRSQVRLGRDKLQNGATWSYIGNYLQCIHTYRYPVHGSQLQPQVHHAVHNLCTYI